MFRVAKNPVSEPVGNPMVHLVGTVAGVDACQILTDKQEIVVGAALDCDLVVHDPLVPRRAFRVRYVTDHSDECGDRSNHAESPATRCRAGWMIEVDPAARVFVNNDHSRRERLNFGDVVTVGCHRFFDNGVDALRARRSDTKVDDICARLIDDTPIPVGFLNGLPSWRDKIRGRKAMAAGITLAFCMILLTMLVPHHKQEEQFVSNMMTGSTDISVDASDNNPSAGPTSSLTTVNRRLVNIGGTPAPQAPADLSPTKEPAVQEMASAAPLTTPDVATNAPPPLPQALAPIGVEAGPNLGKLVVGAPSTERVEMHQSSTTLAVSGPTRRVAVGQPAATIAQADLGKASTADVAADNSLPTGAAVVSTHYASELAEQPGAAPSNEAMGDAPTGALTEVSTATGVAGATQGSTSRAEIHHASASLVGSGPARRVTVGQPGATAAIGTAEIGSAPATGMVADSASTAAVAVSTHYATQLTQQRGTAPSTAQTLGPAPTQALAEVSAYHASPLHFEDNHGIRIPVAHMGDVLAMADPNSAGGTGTGGTGAGSGTPGKGLVHDGMISDTEAAKAWKSGRFKLHAPGTPPDANPATQCWVSPIPVEHNGKQCLDITFLCTDPNIDQILANDTDTGHYEPQYASKMTADDSVEIFLDTTNSEKSYNQMIVNSHGKFWAAFCPSPDVQRTRDFRPWLTNDEVGITTKINKQAGNWVCEVFIPFDKLGGIPAKGSKWGVNFCRNYRGQTEDSHLQTWFEVYEGSRNFHHPDKFGKFLW